jgi:translation initiation factor IF-2
MRRLMYAASLAICLCLTGASLAQPGPGGPGGGPKSGPGGGPGGPGGPGGGPRNGPGAGRPDGQPGGGDQARILNVLEQLSTRLSELEAKLAKAQSPPRKDGGNTEQGEHRAGAEPRGPGGPDSRRAGPAFDRRPDGPRMEGPRRPDAEGRGGPDGGRPGPAFGGSFARGPGEGGSGTGGANGFPGGPGRFGPDGGRGPRGEAGRGPSRDGSNDFAHRLDRIIAELEQLKKDMNGPRR